MQNHAPNPLDCRPLTAKDQAGDTVAAIQTSRAHLPSSSRRISSATLTPRGKYAAAVWYPSACPTASTSTSGTPASGTPAPTGTATPASPAPAPGQPTAAGESGTGQSGNADDDSGLTVDRSALLEARDAAQLGGAAGPTVLAVLCAVPAVRYGLHGSWLPALLWGAVAVWFAVDAVRSHGWLRRK